MCCSARKKKNKKEGKIGQSEGRNLNCTTRFVLARHEKMGPPVSRRELLREWVAAVRPAKRGRSEAEIPQI